MIDDEMLREWAAHECWQSFEGQPVTTCSDMALCAERRELAQRLIDKSEESNREFERSCRESTRAENGERALAACKTHFIETCPKCGSTKLWTSWCNASLNCTNDSYTYRNYTDRPPPEGEHLDRGCQNCQYRWYAPIAGGKP